MSENRRGFRSFDRDYGAKARAVGRAAVGRQVIRLLRTQAYHLYVNPLGLQLRAVRCREVEQELAVRAWAHERCIELARNFLPDLVARAADAGADAGLDVGRIRAELITHGLQCG